MASYKVVGPRAVHGVEPGGTLTDKKLSRGEIDALIVGGHIEKARGKQPEGQKKDADRR